MLKKYGSDKEALYVRNLKRVKSIREDDDTKTIAYSLEKNILIPAVQITFFIEDKESNSFHDYDIIIIDDFNLNFYDSRIKRPATTFVFPRLPTLDFSKSLFL
jgi:methyl coenzyme M reductase beta subunit